MCAADASVCVRHDTCHDLSQELYLHCMRCQRSITPWADKLELPAATAADMAC